MTILLGHTTSMPRSDMLTAFLILATDEISVNAAVRVCGGEGGGACMVFNPTWGE